MPGKKSQASPSAPSSSSQGRRSRRGQGPSPRRSICDLAMLAHVATVAHNNNNPPENPPSPPTFHAIPGEMVDGIPERAYVVAANNVNPDLNVPPTDAGLEDGEIVQPPNQVTPAPAGQPVQHQFVGGAVPFVYALQQAQLLPGIPFNFNGGIPQITFRVCSLNLHDPGVMYTINTNELIYRVYQDYAARVDLIVPDIIIKRFNDVVSPIRTAFANGLLDGDILSVEPQNPDKNVDARYKKFFVQDLVTVPRALPVTAMMHATLYSAFAMWGAQHHVNPNHIISFHQNKVIMGLQTVGEVGIRNNDKLYVFPHNG